MERPSAIVGVGAFAYLIYFHATSSSGEAWKAGNIDITGLLMVLTLKVTACALNYQDAAAPLEAGLMGNTGGGGYASGDTSEADGLLGGRSGRGNEANTGESIQDSLQRGFQDFLDQIQARPLREHIGHTPVQVLAGAILGVVVGATYAWAHGDDILAGV